MTAPATAPPRELVEKARALTVELGAVPSQNQMKTMLKVGTDRARAVREVVVREVEDRRQQRRQAFRHISRKRGRAHPRIVVATEREPSAPELAAVPTPQVIAPAVVVPAEPVAVPGRRKHVATWPILVLALPAFVAIWAGWVGIGGLTGFGEVNLLPGIAPPGGWATLNTAITLPIGMETYAAYALRVWLSNAAVSDRARMFARNSAIGALLLGAGGQVAYHVMTAYGIASAPWWITTAVSCIPVGVLGMGAALRHLTHSDRG